MNNDDVKRVRNERQCSIEEAKRIIQHEELTIQIAMARSVDDLKVILYCLIDKVYKS